MKKITYKKTTDPINFCHNLSFYKDGEEFAKVSMETIQDLTFKSTHEFIKGPELSKEELYLELLHCLKFELNDSSLNDELEICLSQLKDINYTYE